MKFAWQDKNNQMAFVILMVVLILGFNPLIEKLILHFLGWESFWIELLALIPIALVAGVIVRGFTLYPKIAQIIKTEEQNTDRDRPPLLLRGPPHTTVRTDRVYGGSSFAFQATADTVG